MHETNTERRHRLIFSPHLDKLPAGLGLWSFKDQPSDAQTTLHKALHRAIDYELTDKQRTAVKLFFFEGLSQGEIARRLGVSQQVIQKRIYGTQRGGRMVGGALGKLRNILRIHMKALHPKPQVTL